jgi:hypothetical protein
MRLISTMYTARMITGSTPASYSHSCPVGRHDGAAAPYSSGMSRKDGDDEMTRRIREAFSAPLSPAAQAGYDQRSAEFLDGLPDASGSFEGHLVSDACYRMGGCGPDCPVWAGEAEDARGPN